MTGLTTRDIILFSVWHGSENIRETRVSSHHSQEAHLSHVEMAEQLILRTSTLNSTLNWTLNRTYLVGRMQSDQKFPKKMLFLKCLRLGH